MGSGACWDSEDLLAMAISSLQIALGHIDRLFTEGSFVGLADGQLLERFLSHRDEDAFAMLVERHGPMVLAVGRRSLANPGEVDDAFQATFLILARRPASVRGRDSFGGWLYGVASRVCLLANRGGLATILAPPAATPAPRIRSKSQRPRTSGKKERPQCLEPLRSGW